MTNKRHVVCVSGNPKRSALPFLLVAVALALLFFSGGCMRPVTSEAGGTTSAEQSAASSNPAGDATSSPASPEKESSKVLRHAVFFQFKETSSDEDVQGVVDAFRALPARIDTITDFEWGTNNSPEGRNDGLTHCFLLTFADEAGRRTYLPHPEHKAFGDVLRPHMNKVFVFDYWGSPTESDLEKKLRHAVFIKFKDDAPAAEVRKVIDAFAALPSKIDTIKAFEWGTNNSPEGKNDGFTHCFLVTFDSEEGRETYLPHPAHEALVELLMPVLDKVRVLDYWASE